jgi:sodium transport system permease protein
MNLAHVANIWIKEIKDSIRDRKALTQALLIPILLGVGYAVFNPLLASSIDSRAEKPITVPVIGLEYVTDDFVSFMEGFDVTLEAYEGDLEADVTRGAEAAGLVIPDSFGSDIAAAEPAGIRLIINPTAGGPFGGGININRLELALENYNRQIAVARVANAGVDPALLNPIALAVQDLSTPEQRGGVFAALMLPILVGVIVAQGGAFIAIDVTAGEKERGTLEALLVTPAGDVEIFLGKLLAVFTMTTLPLVLTFLAFWGGSNVLPESMTDGAILPIEVILQTIFITLPLALFVNAVLMIVSVRTKAFKDAQSAMTPAIFGVLIPAMAGAFLPPVSTLLYLIPVYGTGAVVSTLATSGVIPDGAILYSIIGSLLAAAVAIAVALRLFDRERLLYSA